MTERDKQLLRREGFAAAMRKGIGLSFDYAEESAAAAYPLPPITRPRVVADSESFKQFCVVNGQLLWRVADGVEWERVNSTVAFSITPNRVRVWHDLLTNPTEDVPDDGR